MSTSGIAQGPRTSTVPQAPQQGAVEGPGQVGQGEQAGQQVRLRVDEREMTSGYSNAFRTNGTAEEVMLDFGVNLMTPPMQKESPAEIIFKVNHRIIMNYHSAKRLAITLSQLIRRHEEQFGELELDVSKRVKKAN